MRRAGGLLPRIADFGNLLAAFRLAARGKKDRASAAHHAIINVIGPHLEARFEFDSYGCRKGKGMDKALARAQPEAAAQVRYMDDMLVFGRDRESLSRLLGAARDFLERELRLSLNDKVTRIAPAWTGIPFLGFRVLPGRLLVRRETWKRFRKKLGLREWEFRRGLIGEDDLASSVLSMTAHLKRADTGALRKKFFAGRKSAAW